MKAKGRRIKYSRHLSPSSLILSSRCFSLGVENDAIIVARAFTRDPTAADVALDQLPRSFHRRSIAAPSSGGHAHAIARLQGTIFNLVNKLGLGFPIFEDQNLARFCRFPALHAPGRAADAVEI